MLLSRADILLTLDFVKSILQEAWRTQGESITLAVGAVTPERIDEIRAWAGAGEGPPRAEGSWLPLGVRAGQERTALGPWLGGVIAQDQTEEEEDNEFSSRCGFEGLGQIQGRVGE